MPDRDFAIRFHEGIDLREIFPCCPSSMVPDSPEDRNIAFEPQCEFVPFLKPLLYIVPLRMVEADGDPIGEYFRAVDAPPAVQVGGKCISGSCGRM